MTEVHPQILADAHKLEADGIVELFRIDLLPSGTIFLKANDSVTWRGNLYEGWGIQMGGVGNSSDEEALRPKLIIANPEGIFSALIGSGNMEGALVTRYRVLRDDLLNDRNRFTQQSFKIYRVVSVSDPLATFELRNILDSPFAIIPARMYIPPQFPYVTLA